MIYSAEDAQLYSELGITGTTYEASLAKTTELLGNIAGLTCLDFGTGTGRTAQYLKKLGAAHVLAVDSDQSMIQQASASPGIELKVITDIIPAGDGTIDLALCAHVFVEMPNLEVMAKASYEIHRVLKPGGRLVVITTNPGSVGADYVSYRYQKPKGDLVAGDPITCLVKTSKPFEINDVYWPIDDMRGVLRKSGFEIQATEYPKAEGEGWLDETRVAPDVIIACTKSK